MLRSFNTQREPNSNSICFLAGIFISAVAVVFAISISTIAGELAPEILTAPFDESAAKKAQKDLAKNLNQKVEKSNSIGMSFELIPPGEFLMGSPESEKNSWDIHKQNEFQHSVRITHPFYLGKYPVRIAD